MFVSATSMVAAAQVKLGPQKVTPVTTSAKVLSPVVTSVTPSTARRGDALSIDIAGANFAGATRIDIGSSLDVKVVSFTVVSASLIRASIKVETYAQLGAYGVTVNKGALHGSGASLTIVGPPQIRSVSPSSAAQGSRVLVDVIGEGFISVGTPDVTFGPGIDVMNVRVPSGVPVQIQADIAVGAGATVGPRDVTVRTPYGTVTKAAAFNVTRASATALPVVNSCTPRSALIGTSLPVTIRGANFQEESSSGPTCVASAVAFAGSGVTVRSFRVVHPREIQAQIDISPTAPLGWRDVSVTNCHGTGTSTGQVFLVDTLH
jgi:hypothetical protein